ncbi:MAG TPA: hypothetical protein DIC60_04580 [Lachnospiraceae bacterium]|nr:hypothetical protein [Lachnospiraceae bacterium]
MGDYKKDVIKFNSIVEILKETYKFQGLWHFTDFTNLESIFNAGELSSRKICDDNSVAFLDGANHDVINRATEFVHSCTRFYYRPKTPTLYDNEGIKPFDYLQEVHIPRPVYLIFSEELIYDKDTIFSNGNATNSPINNTAEFFGSMDWDSVFHSSRFNPEERNYIVNKRHAELLSKKPVSLTYLIKIIFRSNADLKQAIRIWGEDSRYIVDEGCFSDKSNLLITDWRYNNYIKDYKIECKVNRLKLIIYLKRPVSSYKVSWSIEDSNGNNKTNLVEKTLDVKLKNMFNNEVKGLKYASMIKLIFNYNPLNGDIIRIYINGILSIEETVEIE